MKKYNNGRNGKHKKSKVRLQLVVERDTKAILVYTASLLDITLTDLLLDGGLRRAQGAGVVDGNFNVLPEHADGVSLVKDILNNQEGDK